MNERVVTRGGLAPSISRRLGDEKDTKTWKGKTSKGQLKSLIRTITSIFSGNYSLKKSATQGRSIGTTPGYTRRKTGC